MGISISWVYRYDRNIDNEEEEKLRIKLNEIFFINKNKT